MKKRKKVNTLVLGGYGPKWANLFDLIPQLMISSGNGTTEEGSGMNARKRLREHTYQGGIERVSA